MTLPAQLPSHLRPETISDASREALYRFLQQAPHVLSTGAAGGPVIEIALTTVSEYGNFQAHITVGFSGSSATPALMADSGNANLIVPYFEDIADNPAYTVLAAKTEPWGCPANIVRGPILIATCANQTYTIDDCVFFACTANNSGGKRTSNFGLGMISPWSADGWNTQLSGLVMQSPLSYNTAYPFAELHYAPAHLLHASDGHLTFNSQSRLMLHQNQPAGYTCLNIIANLPWMSVLPQSLSIDGTLTGWPGSTPSAIAMVDSGGGPVFLSDPYGYVYNKEWPGPVTCPSWASGSTYCNCTSSSISLTLGDGVNSYSYTIDTASMPPSVRGLSGVLCQENSYMHGYYGMNIGGISMLCNDVLINYSAPQVGFKPC